MGIQGLRHESFGAHIAAAPPALFAFLDDLRRLSSHMERRSWMMLGSTMAIETDARRGREVGSLIRMRARVLGLALDLEEVVVLRDVPRRKAWETIGAPRLLVIGPYRMGFDIAPRNSGSSLTVSIDYERPRLFPWGWLGRYYARWCVRRMVLDAVASFAGHSGPAALSPGRGG
jgi:hypothetical protein